MIRPATRDDAQAFATVVTASQSTWTSWAGDAFQPYNPEQLVTQWAARLDDPDTIAFVTTDVAGHVTAVASAGPEATSFEPSNLGRKSAHLSTLFALPENHGTGEAQSLHDQLLITLVEADYHTIRLWVPEGATRARRFYERNGWLLTGHRTVFAHLPRVEMRRPLRAS
jgi:GNAT superfamily N-acetyltransferase